MKSIIKIAVLAVVVVGAVGLFLKFSGFDFSGISDVFKSQPVVIDNTANVVEEVRRLAELTTASYYEENVIVRKKARKAGIFGVKVVDIEDELVLLVKGKVRIGFDLSKMQEKDIVVDSVSISLRLPEVQILDVITNPSGFETFSESGNWSHDEVTQYKNEVRAVIEKNAIANGTMEFAEKAGKERLTSFMQALGFKTVKFND
jgi:hypothetical protein